ncbi:peptide synthetase [Vibrio sp. V27_P1S3P104]|uniref:condensation domain-containing protein n=1 Tax=unclassified Vibrio TaxID=2614977 RepID=UPI001372D680|nr:MULTISPECIES: condensation domain-containing protein [unclassified Vibrio]NAW68693.1 peptide synthetase [Vibrio sp. V28_P6S34P95]NAX04399.1 peptide synthetase [Vibrio sp. V30_P3S12P165]NAX33118.1 peptide synthetase [Vibrio sp. V29_P1S30P107]NAX36916.1 peptide synthetase [Vibrio sp. V27_P1S3P104]NAX40976.1 peptide synthetase [Vibrio sp. V26_P1S5P106]
MSEQNVITALCVREQTVQASDFEQQVWLHHQQCGDCSHQRLNAFRFTKEIKLSLLLEALEQVIQSLPMLDSRYQLTEDFELIKHKTSKRQRVELIPFDGRDEAIQYLLNWQHERINLSSQAPMEFRLLLGEEPILAIRHHRILEQSLNWQTVFRLLSRFYHGEHNVQAGTQPNELVWPLAHPLYLCQEPLKTAYQWLATCEGVSNRIELLGSERLKTIQRHAETVRTSVPVKVFEQLTKHQGRQASLEHGVMLRAAITAFAQFIAQLSGEAVQTIFAPKQVMQRHHELNGRVVQSGLQCFTLNTHHQCRRELLNEVEQQWQMAESGTLSLPHAEALSILVTWSIDPAIHLRAEKMPAETLRFAPLHSDFDLILALGISCDNHLLLELTTGERLSPYIGSWLLEQFIDSLVQDIRPESTTSSWVRMTHPIDRQVNEREHIAKRIAEAFGQALNVPEFSVHNNFFDFGGHSLIATRVIGKLKSEHQIKVHINDLFSQPTAWGLANHAVALSHSLVQPIKNEGAPPIRTNVPLSFAQASLWKAYAAFGYNELFNIPFALRFLDRVDEEIFRQAFEDVMYRHSALRTLFMMEGETVKQSVVPEKELSDYRWFWHSDEAGQVDCQAVLNQEAAHVFDLSAELPVRLRFVRDQTSGMQYLSFLFHHVVLDEWSVNLLMDDLREAYQARAKGYAPKWQSQPLAFSEYAIQQHDSGRNESHLAYWLAQFEGVPLHVPLLPKLQNQPNSEPSDAGGWVEFKLSTEVVQGLYQLAREQGASLFNVVYAAISLTLKQLGAPSKLIVGTPMSGRIDGNFFDTVGYFTTLAMHVVHFDQAQSVAELITQIKNTINQSLDYADVPIDWVEDALLGERTRKQHLFEVMIQLHAKNKLHGELVGEQTMVRFEQVDPEKSESALGLQFEVMEERVGGEDRIRVLMSYRRDRYGDAQVKTLTHTTQRMLERFAQPQSGNQWIHELLNLEELRS